LRKFCAKTALARVVYEATGAYHSGLERALGAHLPLVKVNPLQARRFAQAQGVRAKTDAVDAKMLAEMGNVFALEPDEPADKIQHDLKELRSFRAGLLSTNGIKATGFQPVRFSVMYYNLPSHF
jgi:transposase